MWTRDTTRAISAGNVVIGGGAPVSIQSMTNTRTEDVAATLAQVQRLAEAGCEIVRVAVPNREAALSLREIKAASPVPIVADIHFDYRLALLAITAGVDKLRLNPGNIGSRDRVESVVKAASERGIPIRIGVNGGSLPKEILEHYGLTAEGMVEAALSHVRILEDLGFYDIAISLKASNVPLTVKAYQLMAEKSPYPLHVGITEAGTVRSGTVKSSAGIGAILALGIGDTIRVSLTGDPVSEVHLARQILQVMGLRKSGIEIISCPTCGRCQIDLAAVAEAVEERIAHIKSPITVAVMGCAVNGPGEAREADIGIAGGAGTALLFQRGEVIGQVPEPALVDTLVREIERIAAEKTGKKSSSIES